MLENATLQNPDFKRILVIRRNKVGDTIMASAAVKLLRRLYPKAYIAVLTSSLTRPLLDDPAIVDLIVEDAPPAGKLAASLYKTLQALRLRRLRFDVCFLLGESAGNAKRVRRWANIPVRVCFSEETRDRGLAACCTHVVPRPASPVRHGVELFQDIVRAVTKSQESAAPYMAPLPGDCSPALTGVLARAAAAPGKKIALCLQGSTNNLCRWPRESILACLRTLGKEGYALFAPVAHAAEGGLVEDLAREAGVKVEVIACTLVESARLLLSMDLLLSVDSGPVHMAAALGVPVLSLSGPTVMGTYPYASKALALATTPGCRNGCPFLENCPANKKTRITPPPDFCPPCMRALPPATVCDYVRQMLNQPERTENYIILEAVEQV